MLGTLLLSSTWGYAQTTPQPAAAAPAEDEDVLVLSPFEVSAEETIQLASAYRLRTVLNVETESVQHGNRRMGVTWTRLAFVKDGT